MNDETWILLAMFFCFFMLLLTTRMWFNLRDAKRQGLDAGDLGYGWETIVVFEIILVAALIWFGSLL